MNSPAINLFPDRLLDELTVKANASPRGRAHLNVHASADDPVQRFFVMVNRHSYVRPHRHLTKSELGLVIRGAFDLIAFDDAGTVTARHVIGAVAGGSEGFAYESGQANWHTLVARVDGSTFFEVKQGPYDAATASEFAPWAPPEGDASVPQFMQWLRDAQPGDAFRPAA